MSEIKLAAPAMPLSMPAVQSLGISLPRPGVIVTPGEVAPKQEAYNSGFNSTNELAKGTNMNSELIWGDGKSGKSTQLSFAAWWVIKNLQKKVLLVSGDGGAVASLKPLIELGLVEVLPLWQFGDNPLNVLNCVTKGFWPVRRRDGKMSLKKDDGALKGNDWYEQYGLIMYESITSIGQILQPWLANNPNAKIPQTPNRSEYYVVDGESWYGMSAPSHVGFLHNCLTSWVHWSAAQKYERGALWTAREQRAEDSKGNLIIGPDAPGNKLTKSIPSWFGGCYHMVATPTGKTTVDDRAELGPAAAGKGIKDLEYRMYIRPHPDASTGITCAAGNRIAAEMVDSIPPYIICNVEKDATGKVTKRHGIPDIWDMERQNVNVLKEDLRDELQAAMKHLKMIPDVTEV